MREHDLLGDEEPQPEPAGARVAAAARLEDVRQHLGRDGRTAVVGLQHHHFRVAAQLDVHLALAMLQRIAHQISHHLRQAVGIPAPPLIALGVDAHAASRMGEVQLFHRVLDELAQIDAPRIDGEAAAQPAAGEVEQVVDHPRHPVGARPDSPQHAGLPLIEASVPQQQLGGGDDGGERVAQVVSDDADEVVAKARGLLVARLAREGSGLDAVHHPAERAGHDRRERAGYALIHDVLAQRRAIARDPRRIVPRAGLFGQAQQRTSARLEARVDSSWRPLPPRPPSRSKDTHARFVFQRSQVRFRT